MSGLIIVDRRTDWTSALSGVEVMTAWDYLSQGRSGLARNLRVYNLCRSFGYQTSGYYVSLLAGARGHRPLPDIATIQDLKLAESPSVLNDDIEQLMQTSLSQISSDQYGLHVYFGSASSRRHERLARALFNHFPAPLLRAHFVKRGQQWQIARVGPIALGDVPESHHAMMEEAAQEYFSRRRTLRTRKETARYDLAILVNEEEKEPPSNGPALKKFEKAARSMGFDVELIDKSDYGHVAEYDALFIRETTAVNHHTYRFARRAEREGLVVIDDPESILRATNKVFLAELMERHRIPQPKTVLIHRGNIGRAGQELGFPCVLKQPDSQFSRGVIKVESENEYVSRVRDLLERSDIVIGQSFEPTDYDWRVGVLDGIPLYACRYYMAQGHWQVVHREGDDKHEGQHETFDVADVPDFVLKVATRAARAVGRGLYGVDLKQVGDRAKIIEVNDNPSIDAGVEDQVMGDLLYQKIMEHFLRRLEARTADSRAP